MTDPENGGETVEPNEATEVEVSTNALSRFVGVLFSPGETFDSIERKPNWLVPLLVLVILSVVTTFMVAPHIDFVTDIEAQQSRLGIDIDADVIQQQAKIQMIVLKTLSPIGPIIAILFVTVVFYAGFRAFGGEGTFKAHFSVLVYTWGVLMLKGILSTAVIMAKGQVRVSQLGTVFMSNPGFLFDPLESPAFASMATSIDAFTIWFLVLVSMGLSRVSRLKIGTSAAIVFSIWLVKVFGGAALSLVIQSLISGGGR